MTRLLVSRPRRSSGPAQSLGVALLLLVVLSATARAEESAAPDTFVLSPGVIVERSAARLYAMAPGGGIDALALQDGKRLWHTERADRPVLAFGGRLLAMRSIPNRPAELGLVLLDASRPETKGIERRLSLPDGARAQAVDGLGTSFRLVGRLHEGALILAWTWTRRPVQGRRSPDGPQPDTVASGTVRWNLETHVLTVLAASEVPPDPDAGLPSGLTVEAGQRAPWRKGRTLFRTERQGDGPTTRLVVHRWDGRTGKPLSKRVLDPPGVLVELIAEDGGHINVSYRHPGGRPLLDEYLWSIFDLGSGARVGQFAARLSAAPFCVQGTTLIYVSPSHQVRRDGGMIRHPLSLKAVDLASGRPSWDHPIGDTRYRGSAPPR